MKRVIPMLLLASLVGFSPTTEAAPKKHKPGTSTPKPKPAPKPAPSQTSANYSGVITSMVIGSSGAIEEFTLRISGSNNRSERVPGCGAKSADHPLLNWAFLEGRLIHVNLAADDKGKLCFNNVLVSAP